MQGAKMNGIQNRRAHNLEKPFPGCMGRMVNLFDLSAGVAGNKLLMDKAHQDGFPLPRSRSNVAKLSDPIGYQIEDKPIGYESRTNKKSSGTPMKMLIAQEMSKEMESKHKPPNVVARLMGLDALPGKQPDLTAQRSQPKCYPRNSPTQSGMLLRYQQQENGFLDKQMQQEIHPFHKKKEYKDVYEVWNHSPNDSYNIDTSPQKGRYNENPNEKNMALVRQKFIEAKRLATDEKLRQSKEFQDALEVLNSNKDLFLEFLREPNSLISQHPYELQSMLPPPQTKRITVLRPSKSLENNRFTGQEKNNVKQTKKKTQVVEANGWDKDEPEWSPVFTNQRVDSSAHPTRIVVLKPSPGKTHDIKAVVSSPSSSPRLLHNKEYYGKLEDDDEQGLREVTNDTKQQICESLTSHQRNETMLTSMFSNGYVGDESSFHKSENEYVEEGNLSDSEVMTPTSRHSWDYVNRYCSPYSSSSLSRASYSPESSVCREAKKRLSERWAMMTSNGGGQEQRQVGRSSSTLGEMLSLSDTKKSIRSGEEGCDEERSVLSSRSCGAEQDLIAPTSGVSSSTNKDEIEEVSPRNLLRSRSVPVSSTAYGARLNVEVPDPEVAKSIVPKEEAKSKSRKSSFKGKVSSLFFSRNKKPSKEKCGASPVAGFQDEISSTTTEILRVSNQLSPRKTTDDNPPCATNSGREGGVSSSRSSSPAFICVGPHEALLSISKPGVPPENQDQPSPISVLEAPFEEDVNSIPQHSGNVKSDHQGGPPVHLHSLKSNLIDKSPPIASIARTLSWDDACLITSMPDSLNPSSFPSEAEEEQEQLLFVQTLLSAAGLNPEEQSGAIFAEWHSPECPLDPSLMDKCVNLKDEKGHLHEAKRRQRRSNQRLLFDCVNATLVDITGYGSEVSPWQRESSVIRNTASVGAPVTVDEVWGRVREWFSSEARCISGESGDNGLVVERVVRKEVVGKGWDELMRLEVDVIGKQIEGEMLKELVDEILIELTGEL